MEAEDVDGIVERGRKPKDIRRLAYSDHEKALWELDRVYEFLCVIYRDGHKAKPPKGETFAYNADAACKHLQIAVDLLAEPLTPTPPQ